MPLRNPSMSHHHNLVIRQTGTPDHLENVKTFNPKLTSSTDTFVLCALLNYFKSLSEGDLIANDQVFPVELKQKVHTILTSTQIVKVPRTISRKTGDKSHGKRDGGDIDIEVTFEIKTRQGGDSWKRYSQFLYECWGVAIWKNENGQEKTTAVWGAAMPALGHFTKVAKFALINKWKEDKIALEKAKKDRRALEKASRTRERMNARNKAQENSLNDGNDCFVSIKEETDELNATAIVNASRRRMKYAKLEDAVQAFDSENEFSSWHAVVEALEKGTGAYDEHGDLLVSDHFTMNTETALSKVPLEIEYENE